MVDWAAKDVRSSRSRFWLWTAFLASIALYGFGKPVYDLHHANDLTLRGEALAERERVRRDLFFRLSWARRESPPVVEEILGLKSGTLQAVPAAGEVSYEIDGARTGRPYGRFAQALSQDGTAPRAAGWLIRVKFRDGRMVSGMATPPPPPGGSVMSLGVNAFGRVVLFAAPLVWLGGLLAGFLERTRGTQFGEVALAAAIAGIVAWVVRPGETPDVSHWVGLGVGLGAMLVALRMIRWLRRIARSRRLHFCYQCDYDLRGNTSGVCPECGTRTPDGELRRKSEQAAVVAHTLAAAGADDESIEPEAEADAEGETDGVRA